MKGIKLLGTGKYVPPFVATNEDYTFVETSDEWITTRTGMKNRHIARGEPTWYMGALAGKNAMEKAGVSPEDIDMIIFTTVSSDFHTPAAACLVQNFLKIPTAISLDINVACTGFAFGLDMARRYLVTGDVKTVLLVSAETLSQFTNYEDRATCVLFGDGAGAALLTAGDNLYGSHSGCDATGVTEIYAKKPRRTNPFNSVTDTSDVDLFPTPLEDLIYMNGSEVYKFATRMMPEAVEKACQAAGIAVEDLDMIIPHQANIRIIQTAIKRLKLPEEKFFINIQKYGNTSSASAAMALDEAIDEGRIAQGDNVCVVGFGAGLTYTATVFQL